MSAKPSSLESLPVPLTLAPMEAALTESLPEDDGGWQLEPKWDGFRCLAFRAGEDVALMSKSGRPLARYFPEVARNLLALPQRHFVLDGELVIPTGDALSFDALQLRLHPAESRIRRLAAETPATLVAFDCLAATQRTSLLPKPFASRRDALENFLNRAGDAQGLVLTPCHRTVDAARAWLTGHETSLDGVVAKRLDLPYKPGERAMIKVKCVRTADCVVGGFRYATRSRQVGSLLLGLYDEAGRLHHVGFTSGIAERDKAALTTRLEKLVAPPGFTGDAPGGPSRWRTERSTEWQPLEPRLVVEVAYDHMTGRRFRHGTRLVRWRQDKAPRQCTFDQVPVPGAARLLAQAEA